MSESAVVSWADVQYDKRLEGTNVKYVLVMQCDVSIYLAFI